MTLLKYIYNSKNNTTQSEYIICMAQLILILFQNNMISKVLLKLYTKNSPLFLGLRT